MICWMLRLQPLIRLSELSVSNMTDPLLGGITTDIHWAPQMIVFSHGFGVGRDSRGMFTDLVKQLPADYGYILLDYNAAAGEKTIVLNDFTEQVRRRRAIVTM